MPTQPPETTRLRKHLHDAFTTYPPGLHAGSIHEGTAFFPGGDGLWKETGQPPWPKRGIMVLGNDFGRSITAKGELTGPTWRNLVGDGDPTGVLREAGVDLETCFFTNAYMGIRDADGPQQGASPGLWDSGFVEACQELFRLQVRLQAPRVILALGGYAQHFVAEATGYELWQEPKSRRTPIARTNGDGASYYAEAIDAWIVALIHPANRIANLRHRVIGKWDGRRGWREGHEGEVEGVREVLGTANDPT